MNELTDVEKGILRDCVIRNAQAQTALQQAQAEAQRRASAFEAAVNTIVRLKGLDPDGYQLAFDLNKDRWELIEIQKPAEVRPPDLLMGPDGRPTGPTPVLKGEDRPDIPEPTPQG